MGRQTLLIAVCLACSLAQPWARHLVQPTVSAIDLAPEGDAAVDACAEDRLKLCASVPMGSASVMRCLSTQRLKLSIKCNAALIQQEDLDAQMFDFQVPMNLACSQELHAFCKDVPHGQARTIRCLQKNMMDASFGSECLKQVAFFTREAAADAFDRVYADDEYIAVPAEGASEPEQADYDYSGSGGVAPAGIVLTTACSADVEKFCSKPEMVNVRHCLRKHHKEISEECRLDQQQHVVEERLGGAGGQALLRK